MSEGPSPSPYVVVDASVSLKWALDDEEAVTQAIALRDAALRGHHRLVAPSLWLYEVTNGLVMAVRRRRLATEMGAQALRHLLTLGVRLADPAASDVYEQAVRYGLTAHDAAYLALAEALRAPLWTGDRRLHAAVQDATALVRWIGEYEEERGPGHGRGRATTRESAE